jgi:hypothetical protein
MEKKKRMGIKDLLGFLFGQFPEGYYIKKEDEDLPSGGGQAPYPPARS